MKEESYKEKVRKVKELFNSGQEANQTLAIELGRNLKMPVFRLIYEYFYNYFDKNKKDITKHMGECYAKGDLLKIGEVVVFELEILGQGAKVVDYGDIVYCRVGGCEYKLFEWKDSDIDDFLINLRIHFKRFLIKHLDLFYHTEPNQMKLF